MKLYRNLRSYVLFVGLVLVVSPSHASNKNKKCAKNAARLLLPKVGHGNFSISTGGHPVPTLFRYAAPSQKKRGEKMINLAHHYRLLFEHERTPASLRLIVPARRGSKALADFETLEKIQKVLRKIPTKALTGVKTIVVNPRRYRWQERFFRRIKNLPDDYQKVISAVTEIDSQKRVHIHLFPAWVNQPHAFRLSDFRHELGHAISAKYHTRSYNLWAEWTLAAAKDNLTISTYGTESIDEDFAEAVMIYLESEAGAKAPKMRRDYPHRFKILDKIFGINL